jgi:hypothetical protein
MKLVSCCHCKFFIPDRVGDGKGIGECKNLVDYKNKGASEKQIEKAYVKLGNKMFWGGDNGVNDRNCYKFEIKDSE